MRLIDADALKENAYDSGTWKNVEVGFHQMVVDVEEIDDAPTVDAVQVVRCKDCAKRGTINCDLDYCGYRQADDWYCADGESLEDDDLHTSANHYGERREDDGND